MATQDVQMTVGLVVDQAINGLEKLANKTYGIGSNLEKVGSRIGNVFNPAMKALAVGVTAITSATATVGTVALKSANEIDEAMSGIARATGATGGVLDGLKETFKNVASDVSNDFSETSDVIGLVNTRLEITGKSLEEVSEQILDASRLNKESSEGFTEEFTRMVGDWSVSVEDAGLAVDKVYLLAQKTGVSMTRLSRMMVQYGSPLRQLGFNFDQAASLLAKFEKEGVNTELVLGSMRIALGKFAREGVDDTTSALAEVIKKIKEAGSTGEANSIALEIFGARAGADMAAAIREGRFAIDDLVESLGKAQGVIDATSKASETLPETMKRMQNSIKTSLEPVGQVMQDLMSDGMDVMDVFTEWERKTDVLKQAMESFLDGVGLGSVNLDNLRAKLDSIDVENIKAGFKKAGEGVKALYTAFKTLVDLIPWQFLIDHAKSITTVIVVGWASGKVLKLAGAWSKLAVSMMDASKSILSVAKAATSASATKTISQALSSGGAAAGGVLAPAAGALLGGYILDQLFPHAGDDVGRGLLSTSINDGGFSASITKALSSSATKAAKGFDQNLTSGLQSVIPNVGQVGQYSGQIFYKNFMSNIDKTVKDANAKLRQVGTAIPQSGTATDVTAAARAEG